jgi:uncharacterized protein YaiL (DUF2058 family)
VQNLREQLLKAGLITTEQKTKAESQLDKRNQRRPQQQAPRRDGPKDGAKDVAGAPNGANGPNGTNAPNGANGQPQQQKPSKKQLAKQPLNRMLDLSDPKTLKILQAIESHRVRSVTKGDIPFHFTLRDGHVRKIFVNQMTSEGLEEGRLAIVEDGEATRHVLVDAKAVPAIKEIDVEAVRFANS